jgi:putative transposase
LLAYDELEGIDWSWLSMDGAMTKAPLAGSKNGANPTDRGKQGVKRSLLTEAHGIPIAVVVDRANRHDMTLVKPTLETIAIKRPRPKKSAPQGCAWTKVTTTTKFARW